MEWLKQFLADVEKATGIKPTAFQARGGQNGVLGEKSRQRQSKLFPQSTTPFIPAPTMESKPLGDCKPASWRMIWLQLLDSTRSWKP